MNLNEPVAWMKTYRGRPHEIAFNKNDLSPAELWNSFEPLYIHPVKELTDEEIITLWNDLVDRTILRKAQEK